jgi:hypothetical protein
VLEMILDMPLAIGGRRGACRLEAVDLADFVWPIQASKDVGKEHIGLDVDALSHELPSTYATFTLLAVISSSSMTCCVGVARGVTLGDSMQAVDVLRDPSMDQDADLLAHST